VKRSLSSGPGLTAVRLHTDSGPIVLDRADGSLATLSIQGQPDRAVALKRRDTAELIAEELRRLDPDDTYASALRFGVEKLNTSAPFPEPAAKGEPGSAKGGSSSGSGDAVSAEPARASAEVAVKAPVEGPAKAAGKEGPATPSLKPVPSGLSGKAGK
jgi:hypothetical protein